MLPELPVHPEFAANGSFAHLRLGRKQPEPDPRQLEFARYLDEAVALPEIPAAVDYGSTVSSWPMYGNDHLGDCTCAAAGHLIQAWSQAAGGMKVYDEADVEALYWQTGTADDGRAEPDVLNFWRNTGIAPGTGYTDRIAAYTRVDPANLDHVRAAIYLFGGVYAGAGLPLTAQGQPVWDTVPNGDPDQAKPYSWGGHAFPIVAYDDAGDFVVVTWGATLKMTGAFFAEYVDEVYAVISPDFFGGAAGSPAGFNLDQLQADLEALKAA